MTLRLAGLLVLAIPVVVDAQCACLAKSADSVANPDKTEASFVAAGYGWDCAAHDQSKGSCETATDTGVGKPNDWCEDQWCIVDKDNCNFKTREVSYTAATDDYFSYEVCDAGFKGNGWVGRCKNCGNDHLTSFCKCGGMDSCQCKAGSEKQTAATDKPAYVGTAESYGYGCMAHDEDEDVCSSANMTADGEDNDWCLDKWCIVDKDSCDVKTREVSYTAATDDYFSYETCEGADFKGNGWVGRCLNCGDDHPTSYCTCDDDGALTDFAARVGATAILVPAAVYSCMI